MREILKDQPNVKEAAVDYDAKKAYVLPDGEFDTQKALAALAESGKYEATVQ